MLRRNHQGPVSAVRDIAPLTLLAWMLCLPAHAQDTAKDAEVSTGQVLSEKARSEKQAEHERQWEQVLALDAAGKTAEDVCTACWSDDQPVQLPRAEAAQLRLFGAGH